MIKFLNNYMMIVSALKGFELPVPSTMDGPIETVGAPA
jgi:hypothetical protein